MSRYSRCPYQNASGTAAHAPLHQPHPAAHQPQLRNPWVAADRAGESQSTNSSSSSRTYRGPAGGGGGGGGGGLGGGPGPPPPLWHAPPPLPADHYNHHPAPATHPRAAHYLIDHQVEVLDGATHLVPHAATHLLAPPGPGRGGPPLPYAASSRAASERDRPVTPASSPGGASGSAGGGAAAVDGCGGHCVAFENFCYCLLQVIFIAGILTGVSLTIAGSVLRHAPSRTPSDADGEGGGGGGGDLAVLVYIGCMLGLVCALLLSVQCCVRRNVKRRKRALRMSMAAAAGRRGLAAAAAAAAAAHGGGGATLQSQGPAQVPGHLSVPHGADIPLQELQYQPLLVRLVQQQATASSSSSGNQRLAAATVPAHYHRPAPAHAQAYRDDVEELDASCSGTPWWRRRADARQHARQTHMAETRR